MPTESIVRWLFGRLYTSIDECDESEPGGDTSGTDARVRTNVDGGQAPPLLRADGETAGKGISCSLVQRRVPVSYNEKP